MTAFPCRPASGVARCTSHLRLQSQTALAAAAAVRVPPARHPALQLLCIHSRLRRRCQSGLKYVAKLFQRTLQKERLVMSRAGQCQQLLCLLIASTADCAVSGEVCCAIQKSNVVK